MLGIRTVPYGRTWALSHGGSSPRGYRLSDFQYFIFCLQIDALRRQASCYYFLFLSKSHRYCASETQNQDTDFLLELRTKIARTMDPYDSDSSIDDAGDYTETGVLLGYASEEATDDTISHLGGWPVRLHSVDTTIIPSLTPLTRHGWTSLPRRTATSPTARSAMTQCCCSSS